MWNKHGRTHLRYLRIETYGADLQLITTVHDAIKGPPELARPKTDDPDLYSENLEKSWRIPPICKFGKPLQEFCSLSIAREDIHWPKWDKSFNDDDGNLLSIQTSFDLHSPKITILQH